MKHMQQCVRTYKVIGVAICYLRSMLLIGCHGIVILAIKKSYITYESTLLQQIATPG